MLFRSVDKERPLDAAEISVERRFHTLFPMPSQLTCKEIITVCSVTHTKNECNILCVKLFVVNFKIIHPIVLDCEVRYRQMIIKHYFIK